MEVLFMLTKGYLPIMFQDVHTVDMNDRVKLK